MYTKDGFHKALVQKLGDDAYLLLANGGHKKLTELLTAASLTADGNNTKLSITVGGTTKTSSVTVPYASAAAKWATARTLTIGSTGKSVNGSTNVSWSLDEIGVYSKTTSDDRFVNVTGDTMTGTLTMKTNGSGSYNQGIRINRVSTSNWALLLIGKSGDATSGTGTSTAGDGAWLIGTPASSNSLIFNLNNASETVGLCLKGHGASDMKWNNNTVWHAGNDGSGSGLDADLLDGYHANGLFTAFSGGTISSSGNTLTQTNHSITIGGTSRTAGSSTCNIINSNSLTGSTAASTSTSTYNLSITSTINGVTSTKNIDKLWASQLNLIYCRDDSSPDNKEAWNTIKNGSSNTQTNKVQFYTIYGANTSIAPTTYGEMLEILSKNANHWQPQLWFGAGKNAHLYYRNKNYNDNTWGSWLIILDSSNYTSYTVTKTGSGASGTWGISISGNASTATKLATART